jgi:hypothetical protein
MTTTSTWNACPWPVSGTGAAWVGAAAAGEVASGAAVGGAACTGVVGALVAAGISVGMVSWGIGVAPLPQDARRRAISAQRMARKPGLRVDRF